jgi:hypothetical protein
MPAEFRLGVLGAEIHALQLRLPRDHKADVDYEEFGVRRSNRPVCPFPVLEADIAQGPGERLFL